MKKRIKPKAGQESVWDYPRPPHLEQTSKEVIVKFKGETIARSNRAYRVLETSHPPVYYLPPEDVDMDALQRREDKSSFCEFKGRAVYWDIVTEDGEARAAAWSYPDPNPRYAEIKDALAFYPSEVEAFVDGEKVKAQEGDFYGGWVTDDIVGPFKGGPGTWGW